VWNRSSSLVRLCQQVEGDASVTVIRGTKRYLFDLTAELEYEVISWNRNAAQGRLKLFQ
jgi:hypothetical protein